MTNYFCNGWEKFISTANSSTYAETCAILEGLMKFVDLNSQEHCLVKSDLIGAVADFNSRNYDAP